MHITDRGQQIRQEFQKMGGFARRHAAARADGWNARIEQRCTIGICRILLDLCIAVGEDGPTHEPIEHLASLRTIPNTYVFRPADATEAQAAWYLSQKVNNKPTSLVLTRQNLPVLENTSFEKVSKGAYVVYETSSDFDTILIATGSEVALAVDVARKLEKEGSKVRVVSMPSVELFEEQSKEYKEELLPLNVRRRVSLEMGNSALWYKYVGLDGLAIGIDKFGASAPANKVIEEYGFTVEAVVEKIKNEL